MLEFGRRNKAEVIYLLKGHESAHRKMPDAGSSDSWENENYPPDVPKDFPTEKKWADTTRKIAARFPSDSGGHRDLGMEKEFGPFGSKVTHTEIEAFLGPAPKNEDLPDWLREAIPAEDGGLADGRRWPEVERVRFPYELSPRRYPRAYGIVYGLLRYHAMTRDGNGRLETWVSVERLAGEMGCSVRWVEKVLRREEKLGMIKAGRRPGKSTVYTLLLPDPARISWVCEISTRKIGLDIGI